MDEYYGFWVGSALIILFVMIGAGVAIKKHVLGILIDARNRISLSRFQIALWTLLIVSAFMTVLVKMKSASIYLPGELWALMAISTGSTALAVIVKGTKSVRVADQAALAEAGVNVPENRLGVLTVAKAPHFSDMFKGEELIDSDLVDISKVQMFFFTIAAIAGYAFVLAAANLGVKPSDLEETYCAYFPSLSDSLVTLIGISHAGYITVKAAPHTPSAP